jgi:hypothetical protein
MDAALLNRLIASIQQDRLVVFCGAGLSMSAPSAVPSAANLTQQIIDEYNRRGLPPLPAAATKNLETLSEHLFVGGYQSLFIRDLVKWRPFRRNPNVSHRAVADFLAAGAAHFGATTNYDELVELAAMELGEDTFEAAADANGANVSHGHRTFLKLHGCVRDKDHTLWCHNQLNGAPPVSAANQAIRTRLASAEGWLRAHLPEKDLVFIGFWSDWTYLNDVFASNFTSIHVPLVIVVDPQADKDLADKAPALWAWAQGSGEFKHVNEKGEDFLTELRTGFSRNLLERVLQNAMAAFQHAKPSSPLPSSKFDGLSMDDLYALRRDVGGVSSLRIPRYFQPDPSMDAVGRAHLLIRHAGATLDGHRYVCSHGEKVRIVNGRTKLISQVKQEFSEEPPVAPALDNDIVICAGGAEDGGVPSHLVRGSTTPTIVRTGTTVRWISLDTAIAENLC